MSLKFLHSGGAGDVIYSLPLVRHLGGGTLYVKPWNDFNAACDVHLMLKPLLERQPYVSSVYRYDPACKIGQHDPAVQIDIDLDVFRGVPCLDQKPMPLSYFEAMKARAPADWSRPWLSVDPRSPEGGGPFALINRTGRYQSGVEWPPIVDRAADLYHGRLFFVGLPREHRSFEKASRRVVRHLPTEDLLKAAEYIEAAEEIYCNQSVCLTIAQGLGKKYHLERAPGFSCCNLGLPGERLL